MSVSNKGNIYCDVCANPIEPKNVTCFSLTQHVHKPDWQDVQRQFCCLDCMLIWLYSHNWAAFGENVEDRKKYMLLSVGEQIDLRPLYPEDETFDCWE